MDRQVIENRIFQILSYIWNNTLEFPLKQNIKLFSLSEINKLLEFLETWNYKYIYILLDQKLKEIMGLKEELKMIKIKEKWQGRVDEEKQEHKIEEQELEQLINF